MSEDRKEEDEGEDSRKKRSGGGRDDDVSGVAVWPGGCEGERVNGSARGFLRALILRPTTALSACTLFLDHPTISPNHLNCFTTLARTLSVFWPQVGRAIHGIRRALSLLYLSSQYVVGLRYIR